MLSNVLYVIGHRHPDTDSIASALAYAELKNELGQGAIAGRLGPLNEETKFATRYFNIEAPLVLKDARCKLRDIDMDEAILLKEDDSCNKAFSLIADSHSRTLYVVDDDKKIIGIVSSANLTSLRLAASETREAYLRASSVELIAKDLEAEIVINKGFISNGKVKIFGIDNGEELIDSILIVSGSSKLKEASLTKAGLVICSCPDENIESVDYPLSLIITKMEVVDIVRIIDEAIPLSLIMSTKILSYQENDYVEEVLDSIVNTRYRFYPVLNDEGQVVGSISRYHVLSFQKKKFVLLDHSTYSQSIAHIDQADIVEVIDHHHIGDVHTNVPIYYRNQILGSTCSIVYLLYQENNIKPSKPIAGMMLSAIISDTLNLKSATTTDLDIRIAKELSIIAEVDIDSYAQALLNASVDLNKADFKELLERDLKQYTFGRYKVAISQTNYGSYQELQGRLNYFKKEMEEYQNLYHYDLLIMMFTDVSGDGSFFLYYGDKSAVMSEILERTFDEHSAFDSNIMSRKQQLVPILSERII